MDPLSTVHRHPHGTHVRHAQGQGGPQSDAEERDEQPEVPQDGGQPHPSATPRPQGHGKHHGHDPHGHDGPARRPDGRIDLRKIHNLDTARNIIADLDRQNRALRKEAEPVPVVPAPVSKLEENERRKLFEVECARYPNRVHIYLNDSSYYNIDRVSAAKMMGYFTQKLKLDGFPWSLQKEVQVGPFKVPRSISEMEALQMLERGDEVLFQPKRIIDLNLSPDTVGSLALLGTPAAAAAGAATLTKQANMKVEGAGREIPYGKPVPVHSFGELKLLHEMYNCEAKINPGNELADISKKVAFFAMKRHNTPYPFAFYKASPGSRWTNAMKGAVTGATAGLVIGGVTGLLLQGPIGTAIGVKVGVLAGAKLGAVGYGLWKGVKELFVPRSQSEINTFEAVDRLNRGDTVIFQEKKMHSASMLIFGKLTWFTDYGSGSEVNNKTELDVFHAMQNQWPEEKKDAEKAKEAAKK